MFMVAWLADAQEEKPERRILRKRALAAGLEACARAHKVPVTAVNFQDVPLRRRRAGQR